MSNLTRQSEDKYYLEPDTEITKEQYDAINSATSAGASGNPSEADIVRLHQESDSASPLFKGPQPTDGGITSETAAGTEQTTSYYELTGDKLDPVADAVQDPQGTTTVSTEEATRPYEAPEPSEEPHIISEEDLSNNPDLAEQGVKAGDPVTLGEPVPEPETQEDAGNTGA